MDIDAVRDTVHNNELIYFSHDVTLPDLSVVKGILETDHFEFDELGAVISATELNVQFRESDITGLAQRDAITIDSVDYTVNDIQRDGSDWATVTLWR